MPPGGSAAIEACSSVALLVKPTVGGRPRRTCSLKTIENAWSSGLLDSAKAITPAMTIARRVSMLELLSTTRPTATGASSPLNIEMVWGAPSSTT